MSAPRRRGRASGGPAPVGEGATLLDGFRRQLLAWFREGLSDQEVADRMRVSRGAVRSWRERNDIKRPARGEGGGRRRPSAADGRGT